MPVDPQRAEAAFLEATALPAGERGRLLDERCRGDAELRNRVEALLAAHDSDENVLDRSPAMLDPAPTMCIQVGPPERPLGEIIGPYALLQRLGEGGMG